MNQPFNTAEQIIFATFPSASVNHYHSRKYYYDSKKIEQDHNASLQFKQICEIQKHGSLSHFHLYKEDKQNQRESAHKPVKKMTSGLESVSVPP